MKWRSNSKEDRSEVVPFLRKRAGLSGRPAPSGVDKLIGKVQRFRSFCTFRLKICAEDDDD